MVKNIYRCENCYRRLLCNIRETNGYCQDFLLDTATKISRLEHIKYKIEFQCDLAKNRLIEMIEQTHTGCYCLPESESIPICEWLK